MAQFGGIGEGMELPTAANVDIDFPYEDLLHHPAAKSAPNDSLRPSAASSATTGVRLTLMIDQEQVALWTPRSEYHLAVCS